jgi:hypothetical protein
MQEALTGPMKCANVRTEEGMVLFDCPHCGLDAEVDEATLAGLWEQSPDGHFPCPVPQGCGKTYVLPTLEEVATRKTVVPPAMGEYHPDPELVNTPPKPRKIEEKPPGPPVETQEKEADPPISKVETATAPVEDTPIIRSGESAPKPKPQTVSTKATKPKPGQPTNGQDLVMAIRTFRHSDWQGGGKDQFDDEVSRFLEEVGADNVVTVTPVSYTDGDTKLNDYGVMIVYKHESEGTPEPEMVWRD